MSLNKKHYDKAKKNASERIAKWVQAVQQDQKNGISRLISNYPTALRRIQFDRNQDGTAYQPPLLDTQMISPVINDYPLISPIKEKQTVPIITRRKKTGSSSADNISVLPPSEHKKSNSDGSICEIRIESQRSQLKSRRSSRLSVEDPFRVLLWSSKGLNVEPCPSKVSQASKAPKETHNYLEVWGGKTEGRPTSRGVAFDSGAVTPLGLLATKKNTTRRRSSRRRSSIRPIRTPKPPSPIPRERYLEAAPRLMKFFRKIYNIVLLFKCTSRILSGEFEDDKNIFKIVKDGEVLTFDPAEFRASSSGVPLTKRERRGLMKAPAERTKDDVFCLLEIINRLPIFAKYDQQIKSALAARVMYDRLGAGRVVVKQGQHGTCVYCVVTGTLRCRMAMDDPDSDGQLVTHLPDIKEGTTFGEFALVRDIMRTATVVCKTDCELIWLTKDDFDEVMRDTWERERRMRMDFLHESEHFSTWTQEELDEVADLTRINHYKDNDVIVGNVKGLLPTMIFIMSGTCRVVKQIPMVRLKSPYCQSYIELPNVRSRTQFLNKSYARRQRVHQMETHNVTVTELKDGDCIGAGEDMSDIHILAKGKVSCLLMNSVKFEISGKKPQLRAMAAKREEVLLDNEDLYKRLMFNMRWGDYKRRVVKEVVSRKQINGRAKWGDVPWSIRMEPRV